MRAISTSDGYRPARAAASAGTTVCARLRRPSARRTSCGCESASGVLSVATGVLSPTTSSPTSSRMTTRRRSSPGRSRRSRRWTQKGSTARRPASTNLEGREAPASSRVMVRNVEQRPVLFALVRELLEHEKLLEFADSLPARARVSEPALPLVVSALHEQLDRALTILVPEDADARDLAEAAAWYLGPERVALLPSRGVRWDSGLRPPPHLVGERARALHLLEQGALVVVSAAAASEGLVHEKARPEPLQIAPGDEQGIDALTEALALAGYERVERAEERGQFAVRGGLVDVFPTTGREPLRIEFFGDEIEQVRAFSPFTQRALHPVDAAVIYAAVERRLDLLEPTLADDEDRSATAPRDLVPVLPKGPDLVWEAGEVRQVWEEEKLAPVSLRRATELDQLPAGQPFAFE